MLTRFLNHRPFQMVVAELGMISLNLLSKIAKPFLKGFIGLGRALVRTIESDCYFAAGSHSDTYAVKKIPPGGFLAITRDPGH